MKEPKTVEQHRHECEARYVANLGPSEQQAFYLAASLHRSAEAVEKLRQAVLAIEERTAL